ncbi:MAG: cold shock domain-containing protein [Phycisphaeraceae bacterium]|nr:cold shock domain-containing protein [Phycisphaeraceae bacterium]
MSRIRGKVKWFNPDKGFGFIVGPGDRDVFVHYSEIEGEGYRLLRSGDTVEYLLQESERGPIAEAVEQQSD